MSDLQKVGPFGYVGGTSFDDYDEISGKEESIVRISGLRIRSGTVIDRMEIDYVVQTKSGLSTETKTHGGSGGSGQSISFDTDEFIVRVDGRTGVRVDTLTFTTNKGNVYGPYGNKGGGTEAFCVVGKLVAFLGRSGAVIDAIGFVE